MKNFFIVCFVTILLFASSVSAQDQSLVQTMKKEKTSITNAVRASSPTEQKDWTGISNHMSQLYENLSAYSNSISSVLKDTMNIDTMALKKYLLVIQVKNQLALFNNGVLQMKATLMLQTLEGGYDKDIIRLDKRIADNSMKLDEFWTELFPR